MNEKRNDLRPLEKPTPASICKANGTSISELMDSTGVPRATLYRWFKTKNKLFCVLVYASAIKNIMDKMKYILLDRIHD